MELKILIKYRNEETKEDISKEIGLDLKEFDSFHDFIFNISQKLKFKISTTKYEIRIKYEDNWIRLIDIKSFYFFVSHSLLLNSQVSLLLIRKKDDEQDEVGFTKEGERVGDACNSTRPNMKIYDFSNDEVVCIFCNESSRDEFKLTKLGPFYGPIKDGALKYYFHELCALWTDLIYLDDNGKLVNVQKEVKRCRKIKCAYCGEKGAGLHCEYESCKKPYHYLCAKSSGSSFNDRNNVYKTFCSKHKNLIQEDDVENYTTRTDDNDFLSDLVCFICKSGMDEDKILICDNCQKGIHTYCCNPEILEIPEDKFYCYKCENIIQLTENI